MAAKKVQLTWLPADEEDVPDPGPAVAELQKNGLAVGAGRWVDDLEKHVWSELGGGLSDPTGADVWCVVGRQQEFENPRLRYGLSCVTAMVHSARPKKPPLTVLVGLDFTPDPESLPTLLKEAKCVDGSGSWAAKIVVAAHKKAKLPATPYRLNAFAHQYFGQWFEVGPAEGSWSGVMFGVTGEETSLQEHAVGPMGEIPEKTVLEYPTHGIKAEVGGNEYEACSVHNTLDSAKDSYWVQVRGQPTKLLFGAGAVGSEDQEVWILSLV